MASCRNEFQSMRASFSKRTFVDGWIRHCPRTRDNRGAWRGHSRSRPGSAPFSSMTGWWFRETGKSSKHDVVIHDRRTSHPGADLRMRKASVTSIRCRFICVVVVRRTIGEMPATVVCPSGPTRVVSLLASCRWQLADRQGTHGRGTKSGMHFRNHGFDPGVRRAPI